jgi:hypothetical protein
VEDKFKELALLVHKEEKEEVDEEKNGEEEEQATGREGAEGGREEEEEEDNDEKDDKDDSDEEEEVRAINLSLNICLLLCLVKNSAVQNVPDCDGSSRVTAPKRKLPGT